NLSACSRWREQIWIAQSRRKRSWRHRDDLPLCRIRRHALVVLPGGHDRVVAPGARRRKLRNAQEDERLEVISEQRLERRQRPLSSTGRESKKVRADFLECCGRKKPRPVLGQVVVNLHGLFGAALAHGEVGHAHRREQPLVGPSSATFHPSARSTSTLM